jgi:hypothetical protein
MLALMLPLHQLCDLSVEQVQGCLLDASVADKEHAVVAP